MLITLGRQNPYVKADTASDDDYDNENDHENNDDKKEFKPIDPEDGKSPWLTQLDSDLIPSF
jgi:hypothetical protein